MARLSCLLLLASAALSKAAFLIDGPDQLVSCEDATYNWTGGAAPYDIHLGRTVIADQRVLRTSKQTTWLVNYPAGALLNIRIDSGSAGSPNYAYAGSKVVQAGTDTSCIPPENANITIVPNPIEFTTAPTRLQACETSTFSWSGGTAPFTLMFLALNSAGLFSSYTVRAARTYDWEVNFPVGTTVYLNVAGSDSTTTSAPSFSQTYYIYNGTTESCVPTANVNASISEPPPTPIRVTSSRSVTLSTATATGLTTGNRSDVSSSLSGGAIAGIIVGVLALLVIYLIYFFLSRRQKKADKERGNVVGMQKLEGGSPGGSLEKVVTEGGAQGSASAVRSGLVPDLKMKGRAV